MLRRGFFAALFGAGGLKSRPPGPDLSKWKIRRLKCSVPCDCMMAEHQHGDFNAEFEITDRVTNGSRVACRACVEELRRAPVRLLG